MELKTTTEKRNFIGHRILLLKLYCSLSFVSIIGDQNIDDLSQRHVFITGGSSGIGLALAHQVASQGARVSLLARSLNKLEEAKESIPLSSGVDVSIFSADVRDYDAVHRAVNDAGPIDVLVVNQGVFVPQELEKQGLDEVRFMIDVNLMGSFNVIKAALPLMKERKDRRPTSIALISSQAGQVSSRIIELCCLVTKDLFCCLF
ncbi:3-dehydrosphinganine reductase TSC10A-like [Durio zibethinus]|uniref:3-dehydrosphinganine reductase TSC10A-like n=1 Tax=Durio zibethinus TaxID=66656 RepID=A0A6P5YNN1_DURZI|nr:3-dehydrosphinganine reductase TSC10A-like [Durio zibethinus]